MTNEGAAQVLVEQFDRDGEHDLSPSDQSRLEALVVAALSARERAVWEKAAKAVENGHFLTNESMEYKWGQQVAAMLRRMAEAVKS